MRQLSARAVAEARITILEHVRAGALWLAQGRCVGVVCNGGAIHARRGVVIATGGAAAMWLRTTNPPGSQGTGLLLAHAAGAELADLELVQFHPTAVTGVPGREGFLVTEAIRGEGATLHDSSGERFVDELLPRDEVSRAIQARLRETGAASMNRTEVKAPTAARPRRMRLASRSFTGRRRTSSYAPKIIQPISV